MIQAKAVNEVKVMGKSFLLTQFYIVSMSLAPRAFTSALGVEHKVCAMEVYGHEKVQHPLFNPRSVCDTCYCRTQTNVVMN